MACPIPQGRHNKVRSHWCYRVTVTGVTFQNVTPVTLCNTSDTLVTVICLGKCVAVED